VGSAEDAVKVLVTGGGGSSEARSAASWPRGHQVIAFQRSPAAHLADQHIQSVQGNIAELSDVTRAARGL
jgi:putative NADH-flavin reductase